MAELELYPAYAQSPIEQAAVVHVDPQAPQFELSVCKLTHEPPQHPRLKLHLYLQCPQLFMFELRSTQMPSQHCVPAAQTAGFAVQSPSAKRLGCLPK